MTRRLTQGILLIGVLAFSLPAMGEDKEVEEEPDGAALEPLLSHDPKGKGPPPWTTTDGADAACHPDEMGILRDLRGRANLLGRRAADLDAREAAVKRLEDHAAEQLVRLEEIRAEILALVTGRAEERRERVGELAKMVSTMKPKAAGPLVAGLEEETAVLVLEVLGAKQAGKVLGAMSGSDALRLGGRYTALLDPRDGDAPADAGEDER